jgi:hypothetical protein
MAVNGTTGRKNVIIQNFTPLRVPQNLLDCVAHETKVFDNHKGADHVGLQTHTPKGNSVMAARKNVLPREG